MKKYTNKKLRKRIISLFCIIGCILLLGICGSYLYIRNKIYVSPQPRKIESNNEYIDLEEEVNESDKIDEIKRGRNIAKEEAKYEAQKGIYNILLIGVDARKIDENARADSITIATIDGNSKNVKFTSIMRDSYVNIKGHKAQKVNAAFAFGGPELLMNTIEKNFKIKLDKYMVVNFWGFQDIVDGIGGLDIDIKNNEVNEINKYIKEVNEKKSVLIERAGLQHLDGQQILAYTRIRHVGNGSYERNTRQRKVLSLIVEKLKDISIFQYPFLLSKLLPNVKTNVEPAALLNYTYTIFSFKPLEIKQLQIPLAELSEGRIYKGSWVLLMDKEQNAKILNDFIFNNTVPLEKNLNLSDFRRKLNDYLKVDRKSNPAIKYDDKLMEKEEY